MIFVTVGTQLPFDRLVRAVDEWARENQDEEVFAQIADSAFMPKHFPAEKFLSPVEYRRLFLAAALVVSHAGVGSILTALELRKPIIIVPRSAALHEHRSDHQLATAKKFAGVGYVDAAYSDSELRRLLTQRQTLVESEPTLQNTAGDLEIFTTLRNFLNEAELLVRNGR